MTKEVLVAVSPDNVLGYAKYFFTSPESGYGATVVEAGDDYVRFQTFRGILAVSARPEDGMTRVRCATLRYHPSIGQFLLHLDSESAASRA